MRTGTLMIQGTASDAGKSAVVTGLCRALARRGVRVAPFKPQNMALNSAVTVDGGEIGRAQAVQARACGVEAHSDMNPVLLKPNLEAGAQVIIQGRAVGNMAPRAVSDHTQRVRRAVRASYDRLRSRYEVVIVEGAGSPAEINLRQTDVANMGFAEAVDCPVVLVADIDRGGAFAHIVGTLALLSASERERTVGFIINRFRGDLALLQPGLDWLEGHTSRPVLGVLPYLPGLHLEAEDALPRECAEIDHPPDMLRVTVPALPHISNHTDFEPLRLHPQVAFRYVGPNDDFPASDLVVLPGSKSVAADLSWLRSQGWAPAIERHLRYGGRLMGICGGFQMLGRVIHDPGGLEGPPGSCEGLALFDMETTLDPAKRLRRVRGRLILEDAEVQGYEIHAGVSRGAALSRPAVVLDNGAADGAASADGSVVGTYLHGLFETSAACDAVLRWAGLGRPCSFDYQAQCEHGIDRLADAVDAHLDWDHLDGWLGLVGLPRVFKGGPVAP